MNKKWFDDAFFYHIYPLGLCGAESHNPILRGENYTGKGIKELESWISYLKNMGITALYIGPLFESETHGYDTINYFSVDRRLGSNQDFKEFVEKCHNSGIKVILDGVFNHVSRYYPHFQDLKKNRENSSYKDWFSGLNFGSNNGYGDGFVYEGWNGNDNLVKLNLNNHDTREHIYDAVRFWIDEFHIDGLRLDAADCLDDRFLRDLSLLCRYKKEDFFLLGEIIHGDYAHWANPETLHSVTNYEAYKGMWSSFKDKNMFEIAWTLKRQFGEEGLYKGLPLYNFLDNHDVDRVSEHLDKASDLYPLYALMFSIPGVPSLYYGSETGIRGAKNGPDDSPMRPRLDLSLSEGWGNQPDLRNLIAKLAYIRAHCKALKYGNYSQISVSNQQLSFRREYEGESVICLFNLEDKPVSLDFNDSRYNRANDLLNPEMGDLWSNGGYFKTEVPASWCRILKLN